jgi:CelD/BcsL family acetyltransferase involved in cellulose biosynthesis
MGKLQLSGRMRGTLRVLMPAWLRIADSYGPEFPPLLRDGLCAKVHRDWPDDPDFIPQWQTLLARNSTATVFCSPAWQSAVVDEFVPARQFRLMTVYRDKQLLALLPLTLNTASMLETPGKHVTDYLDPLVDVQNLEECWSIILSQLHKLWDWSVGGLVLNNIRGDSPLRQLLPRLGRCHGFGYSESVLQIAPFISLPRTWDEYLRRLDSAERKELKRKIRNANERAGCQFLTHTEPQHVKAALERALAAMRQATSLKADFTEEVLMGFLRRLCPTLNQQGDFQIQELILENRPAAWLLVLRSDKGPMIYNTSYEFSLRNWSPGAVSFGLAIQQAIAAGHPVFNFLRGAEEYKKRLGATDLELVKITLWPGR